MWLSLILFAVSFILSIFLKPKAKQEKARPAALSDFRFPRAAEGDPLGIIYGTVRLKAPNTIWYGDFKVTEITKKVKTGLFSSENQFIGYRYWIGLDLSLALGPDCTLLKVWAGKKVAWEGRQAVSGTININKPTLFGKVEEQGGIEGNFEWHTGSFNETPSAYLDANIMKMDEAAKSAFADEEAPDDTELSTIGHPAPGSSTYGKVPAYNGVCRFVSQQAHLSNSTSIEPFNFEVQRLSNTLGIGGGKHVSADGYDMNPMEVLYDLCVNDWGRVGLDPNATVDLPSWRAAADKLYDEGNMMSVSVDKANDAKDLVTEVLRQIDGIMYQDPVTSKVVINLLRHDYDIATLPVFDQSKVLSIDDFSVMTWGETSNQVRVTFNSRKKDYKEQAAIAQDFANISFQGRVKNANQSYPTCYTAHLAQMLATRDLSRMNVPLMKCKLGLTREAAGLRPGDLFVLNWPEYGILNAVMRVQRFDLGELTNGRILVDVVQDNFAAQEVTYAAPEIGNWVTTERFARPVFKRVVEEAPYFLLNSITGALPPTGQTRIWAFGGPPSGFSQKYTAVASNDNFATWTEVLAEVAYPARALVQTTYLASSGFNSGLDSSTGLRLSNVSDISVFASATVTDVRNGLNLILVGKEIMSYRGFTALGGGTYQLNNVQRGLLDTTPVDHLANEAVFFLKKGTTELYSPLLSNDPPLSAITTVGLLDHTDSDVLDPKKANQDVITKVTRWEAPARPAYVTVNTVRQPTAEITNPDITFNWRERNRLDATIPLEDDATETPEAGTTYKWRYKMNSGAWSAFATVSVTTASLHIADVLGVLYFEVYAVRNGMTSWSPATAFVNLRTGAIPINSAPPVISGSPRMGVALTTSDGTWT